jgi:hypothetical protein
MGAVVGLLVLLGVLVGFLVRGARRRGKTVISGPRFAILNLKGADGFEIGVRDL